MTGPMTGPVGQVSGQRRCACCGRPIEVPANNPRKRYCSPRCRVADWHHHHDRPAGEPADDQPTPAGAETPNAVPAADAVPNAVPAANTTTTRAAAPRCPHCRRPVTVVNLLLPPDAAHVAVPDTNPGR